MIDVVFVQQYALPYFGVLALNAHLKRANITSAVVIEPLESNLLDAIQDLQPRLIAFSVLSVEHAWLCKTTKQIRSRFPQTPIIVGGIHAILYPETILNDTPATLVCHSEGEKVLVDIVNEFGKAQPAWASLPGIAYRDQNNSVVSNERARLVQYEEGLIETRDLYYERYPVMARDRTKHFISSRGCPFECSFCQNSYLWERFKGKGSYIRRKPVVTLIQEISLATRGAPIESLMFEDDLFTMDKPWLKAFLAEFRKQFNLPFICQTHANFVDEELADALAKGNCCTAMFGVETGNEVKRKTLLRKNVSNEQIIRAGTLLSGHGMTVQTSSILCLPDETVSDALETVKLNIDARVNLFNSALLVPFPNTELSEYCKAKGLIPADYSLYDLPTSFFTSSVLELEDKRKILNVHYLGYWFVRYPIIFRLFKPLTHYTWLNPIFHKFYLLGHALKYKEAKRMRWFELLRYAFRMRNTL